MTTDPPTLLADDAWVSWPYAVTRGSEYRFMHLIRGPDDPDERVARGQQFATAWTEVERGTVESWMLRIWALLADGRARTFNAICVEMTGRTADVCFEARPDQALWALVESGMIEHTVTTPVLFRRIGGERRP